LPFTIADMRRATQLTGSWLSLRMKRTATTTCTKIPPIKSL
jgi:hypothetical protein